MNVTDRRQTNGRTTTYSELKTMAFNTESSSDISRPFLRCVRVRNRVNLSTQHKLSAADRLIITVTVTYQHREVSSTCCGCRLLQHSTVLHQVLLMLEHVHCASTMIMTLPSLSINQQLSQLCPVHKPIHSNMRSHFFCYMSSSVRLSVCNVCAPYSYD